MSLVKKTIKYPENLALKEAVRQSGYKAGFLAKRLGISPVILSRTINGRHKGSRIVLALKQELSRLQR